MNTYIQNKLDIIDIYDYIVFEDGYIDKEKSNKKLKELITDYHNHTVEKWEHDIKLLKLIHKQELDSIALKSLEDFMEWSELRKLLQDTNPKE